MQLPLRKISRLSQDSKLQLLYLKHTSISRLEGIKRIIKKNKCDCFIIILGIDSRFNRGSMDAASYLFFNAYEMNCDDLCHLKWEFDIFEDVFLCVCPNEVILYCNFASFSLIMPYVSHWPNLRIHFVNENLTNDPEKHEDLKISIFENTMSNLKKVCIPYTDAHGNRVNKFNKLMIENWPLIQSYAYDAKHQFSREFFTLSREVIDVGDDFYQLRQRIDPVFIERFLSKTIISFASSFELTLRSIDSSYQCTQSKELIDRQIKALTSMYKYSKSKSDNSEKKYIYPPFLLYGSKTNKKYLKSPSTLSFLADESDNIHLASNDLYFKNILTKQLIVPDSKQKKSLKALIQIYLHLLSAVAMLINQIKTTLLGFNEIISMTKEEIEKKIGFIKYDEIDIGLEYVLGEPNETVRLLTVMIRVYDVQVEDGETIGSIAFKDTLLISALQLNEQILSGFMGGLMTTRNS
ncbi:pseudouridylate synthase [Schistosoma japonicum]|nr:pseudouridylate synthase [Schistosoma japonicum]